MASATTAAQVAPGVVCPKCKGPMLDERTNKRSDKSPDFTCANMLCVEVKNGKSYRTAIWQKDVNGSTPAAPAVTGLSSSSVALPVAAESGKPKMRDAYKSLTEWVIKEIAPLYADGEFGIPPEVIASCTATLFIQACKSGKVE